MKRLNIISAILLILLIVVVMLFSTSVLFDVERVNKATLQYRNGIITADYVAGNATMQDVLQIRLKSGDIDTVLANYEQYNSVKSIQLFNDSLLEIVMGDSINSYSIKTDTVVVPIKYK
ncbi:MAG: hypothetical protein J0L80_07625 [Chitinophagales bacterium]|nr:hypothetical protein [Chitinophagales bacterium]